ncbi:hypothetical protein BDW75DRAFT_220393 [Aspergillus navahoensis]
MAAHCHSQRPPGMRKRIVPRQEPRRADQHLPSIPRRRHTNLTFSGNHKTSPSTRGEKCLGRSP